MKAPAASAQQLLSYIERHLEKEDLMQEDDPSSSGGGKDSNAFDPKEFWFWAVNALIFCVVVGFAIWYCCFGGYKLFLTSPRNSDEAFRQNVLEREQRKQEKKRESPEKRRKRLLQSFQRKSVSMVRYLLLKNRTCLGRQRDHHCH